MSSQKNRNRRKFCLVKVPDVEDPVHVPSLIVREMEPVDNKWNIGYKVSQCPYMPVVVAYDKVGKEVYFIAFEDELSYDMWRQEHSDLDIMRVW